MRGAALRGVVPREARDVAPHQLCCVRGSEAMGGGFRRRGMGGVREAGRPERVMRVLWGRAWVRMPWVQVRVRLPLGYAREMSRVSYPKGDSAVNGRHQGDAAAVSNLSWSLALSLSLSFYVSLSLSLSLSLLLSRSHSQATRTGGITTSPARSVHPGLGLMVTPNQSLSSGKASHNVGTLPPP